ncbi:hypothetical protein MKY48_08770 [Paenibacillus sp. FSL W8-0187]|uniref:hypothetical protein n=1 Tax=Paenibacillus sp. FSL W8-0187 TaxID=2921710 RepID=UPI0030D94713
MRLFKNKFLTVVLSVTLGLSALTPTYAFASENEAIVSPTTASNHISSSTSYSEAVAPQGEDGIIETQGLKKTALVYALRHGGKALDDLLDWLGVASKEAGYVTKNANKIADFLDSVTDEVEKRLIDFLIFECGIPQGAARVIAYAITGIIL